MEHIREQILHILTKNARLTDAQIAERLNTSAEKVATAIHDLEAEGLLKGYVAILNDDANRGVSATIEIEVQPERDTGFDNVANQIAKFPEVTSVFLMSGRYDLRIEITGNSLQDVANFVATKLATLNGVKSTATSFLLKRYKESGVSLMKEEKNERLQIVP